MEIKPVVTKANQRAALKEIESLMSARPEHPAATDRYPGDIGRLSTRRHSTVAPEEITTLAHFSVSAAMTFPKSSGVPDRGLPPSSANRARIAGSASARFTS